MATVSSIKVCIDDSNTATEKPMEKTKEFVNNSTNEGANPEELEAERTGAPDPTYKCQICSKKFVYCDGLSRHMQLFPFGFKCEYCDKCFHTRAEIRVHVKRHLAIKRHKCSLCNKVSASATNLKKHMLTHVEPEHQCDICLRTFRKQSSLDDHKNVHLDIRPYECHLCLVKYSTLSGLRRHQNNAHTDQPAELKFPETPVSEEQTTTSNQNDKTVGAENPVPRYVCSICSSAYDSRGGLNSHLKKHTSRFQCEICGKKFGIASGLDIHIKRHLGIQPFQCNVCKTPRTSAYALRKHMEQVHHKEGLTCDICGSVFFGMDLLEDHRKVHLNTKLLNCTLCTEAFFTFNELIGHRNMCHSSEQKRDCVKLNVSIKTVLKGKKSNPNIADEGTSKQPYGFQMLHNKRAVTKSISPPDVNGSALDLDQLNKPEGPFMCGRCDKKFLDPAELQKHADVHRLSNKATTLDEKKQTHEIRKTQKTDYQTTKYDCKRKSPVFRNEVSIVETSVEDSELKDAEQEFQVIIEVIDGEMEKRSRYSVKTTASTDDSQITPHSTEEMHLHLKAGTNDECTTVSVVKTEKTELSDEEKLSPTIFNELQEIGCRTQCETWRKIHKIDSFDDVQNSHIIKTEPDTPSLDAEGETKLSDNMEFLSEDEAYSTVLEAKR